MDSAKIRENIKRMKNELSEMLAAEDIEPFLRCNLESIDAHVTILYNELGLDVDED